MPQITSNRKGVALNVYTDMTASRCYRVTYKASGVADRSGNKLAAQYRWTFQSGTAADTTAPSVASSSPLGIDGAVNISTSQAITLTFDDKMDWRNFTTDTIYVHDSKGLLIPYNLSFSANALSVTLTPAGTWPSSEDVRILITPAARDWSGNPMATLYEACFSTDATACP